MPFFERRSLPADDFFGDDDYVSPATCRCDLTSLDYSRVTEGRIECRDCGRVWRLHVNVNSKTEVAYGSWWPTPCPKCHRPPEECFHYGKKKKSFVTDG